MGFTGIKYNTEQRDIEELLESVDRPGDYCVHSKLVSPMPRLDVRHVGTVAFPVQPAQVRSLVEVAERAPYGKGPETVLDTSVRDCWQIDSAAIRLGGQGWTGAFRTILEQVSGGLGCPSERLEARPYKLLVYEPGGFFTPHRDTEKEVGMVGTLVISLPTEGAGGELVVRHKDREQVIDMCVSDPSVLAYAAFYADCTHETRPLQKGHRVALVFNLILRGPGDSGLLRAPDYTEHATAISSSLRAWSGDAPSGAKIVWLLDHDYSTAGLSFATLKGTDAVVARTLASAANRADCLLHAAIVQISEYGSGEYGWYDDDVDDVPMGEVEDWDCSLDGWIAPDDSRPNYGEIPLLNGELLPDGALANADPDERRVEEASGNAGVNVEHVYRKAALVVWPRAGTIQALARGSILGAIEYIQSRLAVTVGRNGPHEGPTVLGEQLIDAWTQEGTRGWRYDPRGECVRKMIAVLVKISDPDLTVRFLTAAAVRAYSGVENGELIAAARQVGAVRMAGFLPDLVRTNVPRHPETVLNLLWGLKETHCDSGCGEWRELLATSVAEALLALPRALSPQPVKERPWEAPEPKSLDAQAICDLFSLTHRFELEPQAMGTVRMISTHPNQATPDRTIPQALALMRDRNTSLAESRVYQALWRHASAFLLSRSGSPPEEPRNWLIDARVECNCSGCIQLKAFCNSPKIKETKIAVAQSERAHLRRKIDDLKLDIDYVTERKGRPYRLVCLKNRASHKRRLAEYAEDIKHMRVLIRSVPSGTMSDARSSELNRLRMATARLA